MSYYVSNEELVCSTCGNTIEVDEANICPVCDKIFCKDCTDSNGELWCDEDNEELTDLESYLELENEVDENEEDAE